MPRRDRDNAIDAPARTGGLAAGRRLLAALSHPRALWFAALLGFLLALPSLGSGLWLDDYQQRTTMLTDADSNPFEFYHMGTAATDAQLQRGVLPWWTHPEAKLVFYRPIAHWLMQLDYRWWPDRIPLMHLHSILWYALLIVAVGVVYRRLMPSALAAGAAAVLFALDAAHGGAVVWLANRNAMVAMAASMLTLLCYTQRRWYWQVQGCLLFAASMACAEAALAITGYLFAYEVFLSKQRWPWRIARLVPYALIAVLWLAFWHQRGYGSAGPGFYTDPASDPLEFLRGMSYRAPVFLFGQMTVIPVEIFWVPENSRWRLPVLCGVLALSAFIAKFFWPVVKEQALARFYVLGMCIATLPLCGSQLVSRSLWYVGFGALGLLALLIERHFGAAAAPQQVRPRPGGARFVNTMLVLHLAISPLLFLASASLMTVLDTAMDSRTVRLPNAQPEPNKVLALSAQHFAVNSYYQLLKDEALALGAAPSRPPPSIARLLYLTNGEGEFELWRKDADTLVVRRADGFAAMREGKFGFDRGETMQLDDVAITVREITADRAAVEIEYRFRPNALAGYQVIAWQRDHFAPAALPAPGAKAVISVAPPS